MISDKQPQQASAPPPMPFAKGWNAHANRHSIWIVSPDDFRHHRAFDEVAQALEQAFRDLGGSAPITRNPAHWRGRSPIIFGGNLLQYTDHPPLPSDTIIVNLEQVVPGCIWINDEYVRLLSRYPVLDYSRRNLEGLRGLSIEHAQLLEIGYSSSLARIPSLEKDIDVLFYGALSQRRLQVLDAVAATGLRAVSIYDTYGSERDALIARSKIVLNLHHAQGNAFEAVRVFYLMTNGVCVVSEGSADDPDLEWALGGIEIAALEEIPPLCFALIQDSGRRTRLAEAGFQRMAARPQSMLLQQCVERAQCLTKLDK